MDGGLLVSQWMQLWQHTHQSNGFGIVRTGFPDGLSLMEQPALAIAMLDLVGERIVAEAKERSG